MIPGSSSTRRKQLRVKKRCEGNEPMRLSQVQGLSLSPSRLFLNFLSCASFPRIRNHLDPIAQWYTIQLKERKKETLMKPLIHSFFSLYFSCSKCHRCHSSRHYVIKSLCILYLHYSWITDLFGCALLVATITNHHVRALASKPGHDSLETAFFSLKKQKKKQSEKLFHFDFIKSGCLITSFCGAVNVFNIKDSSETVERDFGKSWNKLCSRHEDIDAIRPWLKRTKNNFNFWKWRFEQKQRLSSR